MQRPWNRPSTSVLECLFNSRGALCVRRALTQPRILRRTPYQCVRSDAKIACSPLRKCLGSTHTAGKRQVCYFLTEFNSCSLGTDMCIDRVLYLVPTRQRLSWSRASKHLTQCSIFIVVNLCLAHYAYSSTIISPTNYSAVICTFIIQKTNQIYFMSCRPKILYFSSKPYFSSHKLHYML